MNTQAETPKTNEPAPNNPAPVVKKPETQAEFYQAAYKELFNKLPKDEQESLLTNLGKPNRVIRGQEWPWTNVTSFIKGVAELAEERYEKAQVKAMKALTAPK